jgi:hypothetical protein
MCPQGPRKARSPADPDQHPPGEKPSISVMLAEPPSVEGIGGGQMVEAVLDAAAVVLADCVEVSSPSPGNSRGIWEPGDEEALVPLVPPPAGVGDPLIVEPAVGVVAEPFDVAGDVADEDDEVDGGEDVDTPRESDPGTLLVVGASDCVVVWACAIVEPRMMITVRIVRFIRILLLRDNCGPSRSPPMQDNARAVKNENEV